MIKHYLRAFFSDKHGKIVIWQTPNLPLILWFVFMLVTHITHGEIRTIYMVISDAALLIWTFLEVTQGVNYFRRTLGFVVLVATVSSRLW